VGVTEEEQALLEGIHFLRQGRHGEAEERFLAVILAGSGFPSLGELDRFVRRAAAEQRPTSLLPEVRAALLGLGLAYAREQEFRDAEDCVLNAAYSSPDPALWVLAGTYYLALYHAEVDTALAYLEEACRASAAWYGRATGAVSRFTKTRLMYYPYSAIVPYIEHWERFEQQMEPKPEERAVEPEWVAGLFEVLEEFHEAETAKFRERFGD
jgi:tetratricopeptide (TPR) repeat protein